MVEIVPFQPEHLAALRLQAVQASLQPMMNEDHGRQILSAPGYARTALHDGKPVACAGLIELWAGRAYAWTYLAEGWERHRRAVHRAVLHALMLAGRKWRRIEMAVDARHAAGKRWAWHLGFNFEGLARAYTPDGRDCEIWSRIT